MEKAFPFPTGYGFRDSNVKEYALDSELQIKSTISDCLIFNFFIAAYSLISIICKILELAIDVDLQIETYIMNSLGFLIWIFGIYLYFRLNEGYQTMKSAKIRRNSILLLAYLISQYVFILISANLLYWEGLIQVDGLLLFFLLFVLLLFCLYVFFVNFSLAQMIKEYYSLKIT
jgi:hypothetical protein